MKTDAIATKIADRLDELGWEIYHHKKRCPKCTRPSSEGTYCSFCGTKLQADDTEDLQMISELMEALTYAGIGDEGE